MSTAFDTALDQWRAELITSIGHATAHKRRHLLRDRLAFLTRLRDLFIDLHAMLSTPSAPSTLSPTDDPRPSTTTDTRKALP